MSTQGRIPKEGTRSSYEAPRRRENLLKQAPKDFRKKSLQGAITKNTKISKIVKEKPGAVEILFDAGLSCVGCPMMAQETIEQGCLGHAMSKEKINELIKRLNKGK